MYAIYEKLRNERGVKDADVSKATGVGKSTFSDWKKGRSAPKDEKLQKIADYFGVSTHYLRTGKKLKTIDIDSKTILGAIDKAFAETGADKRISETFRSIADNAYNSYYTEPDTAKSAQDAFDDPDLRMLFDAARGAKSEDIKMAADLLRRLKETNPDG